MDGISWKRIDLEPDIESTSYATPIVQRLTANARKSDKNMEKLSGVMIIIMIGGSVLIAVLLFIFAKRQIMRFTLRSRRGPHVPVGNDAKKVGGGAKCIEIIEITVSDLYRSSKRKSKDAWIAYRKFPKSLSYFGLTINSFYSLINHCHRTSIACRLSMISRSWVMKLYA